MSILQRKNARAVLVLECSDRKISSHQHRLVECVVLRLYEVVLDTSLVSKISSCSVNLSFWIKSGLYQQPSEAE